MKVSQPPMYKRFLIPTDGSELSQKAVQHGIALAKTLHAKVTALTVSTPFQSFVIEPGAALESMNQYSQLISAQSVKCPEIARHMAEKANVTCDLVHTEHEHPYESIIDIATERRCDLIVMASHGRHGVSAILLGSVTVKALTHCAIPILVYR